MKKIEIYDTTLRDGAQGEGVSFSLQDKLAITERLDEMGFDFVEGGYPLSNEKDAEYFRRVQEMDLKSVRVCAFGMTRRRGMTAAEDPGMKALVESGAPVVTIVGKTHDFQVTDVLRVSLEENLEMIRDSVAHIVGKGREVIYDAEHFFDGWKANPEYAAQTIKVAAEAGARIVILCDTNGGSLPEEIAEKTKAAIEALSEFGVPVGVHTHNDGDLAVANALAAVGAGAVQVQGTINGFGERCGNSDLVSVVANLAFKKQGYEVLGGTGFEHLTELSRFVYDTANVNRRNSQAFVGQSAFAHKGGMHVHAINRAASSYEHIQPELVGNERRVLISELSGRSNIMAMANKYNIDQDKDLMDRILARVVELENQGFQFEAAEASFDLLVKKVAGTFTPHFHTHKYRVEVEDNCLMEQLAMETEATVKLSVDDQVRHEVGEGDGPVDALSAALRKALEPTYPALRHMKLVDYKVRVVNSEAGTAARIRVTIECSDEQDVWGTIGVSENIIQASWNALVDAVEFKLYKDQALTGKKSGKVEVAST
ncbi:MAG: citramalate synthase [Pirellulaceae bacterium]